MTVITDILFLFVYLITLFYFGIPDITNNNYLLHKIIIFLVLFVFNYVVDIIKKIKNKSKTGQTKILGDALHFSLYGIIGYALYVDIMYMDFSCGGINIDSDFKRYFVAALIISIFMLFIKSVKLILQRI